LEVGIHILYCGDNSRAVALTQVKFSTVKDHGRTYNIFESLFYFKKLVNMAIVENVEVMLGQALNFSVYNSVLMCNVIFL
jgi:hypothetical protein